MPPTACDDRESGLGGWVTARRGSPCPVCGKPDWCRVRADGRVAACRRQEQGAYRARADKSGAPVYLHRLGGERAEAPPPPPHPKKAPGRAGVDDLDRAYRALLAGLPLSASHREKLRGRGLSDEVIARNLYASLPLRGRARVARELHTRFGDALLHVPGFVVKDGDRGRYVTLAGPPGLLVPTRDAAGRVVAIVVRRDVAAGERAKYVWLSSAKAGGPGPGSPPHLPRGVAGPCEVARLTEGALKADVAFALSGVPTAGASSVVTWRGCVPALRALGVKRVLLAFDADFRTNAHVARALAAAAEGLQAEGFAVEVECWDMREGKGIDDVLAAGGEPRLVPAEEALAETRPAGAGDADPMPPPAGDSAALQELLRLAASDHRQATTAALRPEGLRALAGLHGSSPGELELFYRALKQGGVTARELASLRSTVRQAARIRKDEQEARRRQEGARRRQEARSAFAQFSNFAVEMVDEGQGPREVRVGLPVQVLADHLGGLTNGWPRRVGPRLFAPRGHQVLWLDDPPHLFAWASGHLDPGGGRNRLLWAQGDSLVSEARFHAYLGQTAEAYEWVETCPHEPPMPNRFYLHPPVGGGDGRALRLFLAFFCPATELDQDLLKAAVLTQVWGGPPGSRPAFLITTPGEGDPQRGRGVGKTEAAMVLASLPGGGYIEAQQTEKVEELKTRLLSPAAADKRTVLLDNIKSLRFSWAELEALVTQQVISGRQLYVGEGQRPNTLTWFLTVNGASLSKDMAQRCVIVHLARPEYLPTWREDVEAFVREHRWAILGDALAELRRPEAPLARYSRWSLWERQVLSKLPEPADAQKVIAERQAAVDDDRDEMEAVRDALWSELKRRGHDPEREVVRIRAADMAAFVSAPAGKRLAANTASAYLRGLGVPELRKDDQSASEGGRGWVWTGRGADPAKDAPAPLRPTFGQDPF